MTTIAALHRDVTTRHGIYPAGLPVHVTGIPRRGKRRLCLDPHGIHLGDRCHTVTVPADWVTSLAAAAAPATLGRVA